jgi:uncharacterized membrane protein YqjE
MTTTHHDGRTLRDESTGDLVKRLSQETSTLIRQEMALARAELKEQGKKAGLGAGLLGGSGIAALLALGSLTACVILALDLVLAAWLAALIVTVIWGAVAGVLAMQGKNKVQEAAPPVPEEAMESVKEDVEWAKTRRPSDAT